MTDPHETNDDSEEEGRESLFQKCEFEEDHDLEYSPSKHTKCASCNLNLVAATNAKKALTTLLDTVIKLEEEKTGMCYSHERRKKTPSLLIYIIVR